MRKRYDKAFKAKVAIEALRGEKTLQEIGTAYGVHPNMIAQWCRGSRYPATFQPNRVSITGHSGQLIQPPGSA